MPEFARKYERQGLLWIPRYRRVDRYEKYLRRFRAAPSIIQSEAANNAASSIGPINFPTNITAGNAVYVAIMAKGSGFPASTNFTVTNTLGDTYNAIPGNLQFNTNNFQLQSFLCNSSAGGGTGGISASLSGATTVTQMAATIVEISGLSASPVDVHNNSTNTVQTSPPIQPGSVTGSFASEIFLTALSIFIPAGTWSIDSSFTVLSPTGGGTLGFLSIASRIVSSVTTTNPSWSNSGGPQFLYANIVGLAGATVGATPWGWNNQQFDPSNPIQIVGY